MRKSTTMRSFLMAVIVIMVAGNAMAQEASPPKYLDVIRTCGAEWQERADKATNKGRDAWNAFRAECVKRKGYVTKAARRADFVRVPDAH